MADTSEHSDDPIAREATHWFALLLDPDVSDDDKHAFRGWLEKDARHVQAFAQMEQLWSDAGLVPRIDQRRITRRDVLKGIGAVAVLGSGGALGISYLQRPDVSTTTGQTSSIMLSDGSSAELSTGTGLSLDFTNSRRLVRLHSGEAFFHVAKEAARPFLVAAGGTETRALGTKFSVGIERAGVRVTVVQHSVEIVTEGSSAQVSAGSGALFTGGELQQYADDAETRTAWRNGRLIFISRPFAEVVEVLERWRRGRIIIMDEALARRPVTLILDIGRIDNVLDTLASSLPVRVDTFTPWLALIRSA